MLTYSDEGGVQKKFARRRNDQIGMPELKFFKVKKIRTPEFCTVIKTSITRRKKTYYQTAARKTVKNLL